MFEISTIEILAGVMMSLGDIFVLISIGSASLALLLSFTSQRQMFIRLWAIGAFALVASLIGLIAKVNWQDTQAFPVGLILPMSNILVGLLLAGTAIILVVAIVCRRRFA